MPTPSFEVESTRFTLFVRGPAGARKSERPKPDVPAPATEPMARVAQPLDADQTYRYAEASGDRTKIHLDAEAARRAGFASAIACGAYVIAVRSALVHRREVGGYVLHEISSGEAPVCLNDFSSR